MEDKKLVKVIFQYDDGSSKYIDGDMLDKWQGFNRQVSIFAHVHNNNPAWEEVKWTEDAVQQEPVQEVDFNNVKSAS